MKKLLIYILGSVLSIVQVFGQELNVSFSPILKGDSVTVEIIATGDSTVELGSSNFVYTLEGGAVDVDKAVPFMPIFSNNSYSMWNYSHNDKFEHIFLSRTNRPKGLKKISNLSIGKVSYVIKDKCQKVHLKWNENKGDIRSFKKSIKKHIVFKDTAFSLVSAVLSPKVTQEEEKMSIDNPQKHLVKWYRDGELISEENHVLTTKTGVYYATIFNGCETKTTNQYRVDKLTAQEEIVKEEGTKIFPNPVIDKATLILASSKLKDVRRVVLINDMGQELKELTADIKTSSTILSINEWNLTEGTYYIKVIYQDDSEIIRFVY